MPMLAPILTALQKAEALPSMRRLLAHCHPHQYLQPAAIAQAAMQSVLQPREHQRQHSRVELQTTTTSDLHG